MTAKKAPRWNNVFFYWYYLVNCILIDFVSAWPIHTKLWPFSSFFSNSFIPTTFFCSTYHSSNSKYSIVFFFFCTIITVTFDSETKFLQSIENPANPQKDFHLDISNSMYNVTKGCTRNRKALIFHNFFLSSFS